MNGYRCFYWFPEIYGGTVATDLELRTVTDLPGEAGLERLGAFVAGFWLTEALELCTGSDDLKKYWIPQSAIQMIEIYHRPTQEWNEQELEDPAVPEII